MCFHERQGTHAPQPAKRASEEVYYYYYLFDLDGKVSHGVSGVAGGVFTHFLLSMDYPWHGMDGITISIPGVGIFCSWQGREHALGGFTCMRMDWFGFVHSKQGRSMNGWMERYQFTEYTSQTVLSMSCLV